MLSLTESVTVPAGSFINCLKTKETEPLDPSALENKYYAAGIGNVLARRSRNRREAGAAAGQDGNVKGTAARRPLP